MSGCVMREGGREGEKGGEGGGEGGREGEKGGRGRRGGRVCVPRAISVIVFVSIVSVLMT